MRKTLGTLVALVVCLPGVPRAQAIEHVVVVVLDDVGVDKVAAYGLHPTAGPTPLLDGLAAEGVMFTRAYADPVCAASRCAALSGLYSSRTGVGAAELGEPGDTPDPTLFAPSDDLPWLPRILARDGVRSGAVGKWHLTHNGIPNYQAHAISVGFERFAGSIWNLGGDGGDYKNWLKTTANADGTWQSAPSTTYATTDSTTEALNFLLDTADARSFVWLAFNATHKPWHIPPFGTYTPITFPFGGVNQQQAMLESLEHYLGEMMAEYSAQAPRAAARTLWLIVGDNGTQEEAVEPPWNPDQAKGTCYDAGTRVPLIAWGAGVERLGATCNRPVHIVDIWATILDAFDVSPPLGIQSDSVSFLPALSHPATFAGRGWAYTRLTDVCGFGPFLKRDHAATDGTWKLIEHLDGSRELYQLITDPLETDDLWPPSTPEQVRAESRLSSFLAAAEEP